MNGLPGVGRVRSVSGIGLSIVYVEFDWGTEIYREPAARDGEACWHPRPASEERGAPRWAASTRSWARSFWSPSRRPSLSPMELREIADFTIRPQLLAVPGVAQVIPIGGEVRQFLVSPNTVAMKVLEVSAGAASRRRSAASAPTPAAASSTSTAASI